MRHIFTYGSLMFADVFDNIVRGRYQPVPAYIKQFKRTQIHGDSYPVVLPNPHAGVLQGVVYLDVSTTDCRRLDRFEGVYYKRQSTQAWSDAHEPLQVDLYVLKPKFRYLASRRPWSAEDFQNKHKQRFRKLYQPQ